MQLRLGETNTTRALARMAKWAKVTHEIDKTEFPKYDVLARFQPFFDNLLRPKQRPRGPLILIESLQQKRNSQFTLAPNVVLTLFCLDVGVHACWQDFAIFALMCRY